MLRYSSGLTVTATTPRRPGGDSGRARRKVRGAARGDGGGSAGRGGGLGPPAPSPLGLAAERFAGSSPPRWRGFHAELAETSFCAALLGAGKGRAFGASCWAFVSAGRSLAVLKTCEGAGHVLETLFLLKCVFLFTAENLPTETFHQEEAYRSDLGGKGHFF